MLLSVPMISSGSSIGGNSSSNSSSGSRSNGGDGSSSSNQQQKVKCSVLKSLCEDASGRGNLSVFLTSKINLCK